MLKSLRNGALFFVLVILLFASSCMPKTEEIETRTPEMEAQELNATIEKLEKDGFDVDTTELGIYYVMHEEGVDSLPLVQPGDTCFLEYTGYLINGTVFDASQDHFPDGIWKFIFKKDDFIPGFVDGIGLMKKGTKMDMIIPSEHAYGSYGQGAIPPYSPLVFSVVMHDLKPVLHP